jgi:glyoxylase-like metal-dependent hydrolase (beta-lactamase superfamily II)
MIPDPLAPLEPGRPAWLAPGLRRVLAANPSALTGPGTNSYILGEGRVALIDPGPDDPAHRAALLAALAPGEVVEAVVVTHAHHDHSALAPHLARQLGAPVLAFGDALAGRNPAFSAFDGLGGGEGLDNAFRPDATLADDDSITGPDWTLQAIHTPGHLGNHICLRWGDTLFSGDMAMGWSTSIVSPPDGDMAAYMASLHRLSALAPRKLWPGHGAAVTEGPARLAELIAHRQARESQIRAGLADGPATASDLAARVYRDLPASLLPAAERNVLAHLLDLHAGSAVLAHPSPSRTARWTLR